MEIIKIILFTLGSFFGIENSPIASEKTTVTIHSNQKTITIKQEHLFSLIRNKQDSITVYNQLEKLVKKEIKWSSDLDSFTSKEVTFTTIENGLVNATLELSYSDKEDLKVFGIDINREGNYSITNFPSSNLQTKDGQLNDNYWNFSTEKDVSYTVEPFNDIPKEYKPFKKNLIYKIN